MLIFRIFKCCNAYLKVLKIHKINFSLIINQLSGSWCLITCQWDKQLKKAEDKYLKCTTCKAGLECRKGVEDLAGHDVQYGKHRTRRSFSRIKEVLDLPNLIEIQTDSFKEFLDTGLKEVFEDVLPISNFTDTMELEFVGYELKEPKYTLEEARIHDASYSAPIFVTFRLINKETGEIKTQEVFFGDFPIMTEMGTFIINGGERIIVSQLVRSPGVYFNDKVDKNGKVGYGSTVIPNRGAWLELETDSKDIAYTRIDRTRKIPFTTLVRALGFSGDDEIVDIFGDSELVRNTIEKDIHKNPADSRTDEALKEIYERLRPGEPKLLRVHVPCLWLVSSTHVVMTWQLLDATRLTRN